MKNPFAIFGIAPEFDLDLGLLAQRYRTLVTEHHPDKGGETFTMEKINTAYSVLKNPVERARALLELNNGITTTGEKYVLDPVLLEEIFDVRACGDSQLVLRKQQQAFRDFADAFSAHNLKKMQSAYWYLLYLHKS